MAEMFPGRRIAIRPPQADYSVSAPVDACGRSDGPALRHAAGTADSGMTMPRRLLTFRVLFAGLVVIMEEVLVFSSPEPNRSRMRMLRPLTFAVAAVAALVANVAWSAGPRGEIIAETAAARHGLSRAWFSQVQMDVGRARVQSVVLDDGTLFVQTDRAMVQAINAETGQTLWSKQVGKPNHPTMTPGVSRDLVVVLNGSRLFALNRANGDLLYEIQVSGPPGAGAGVSAKRAFVPMLNGMVVAYRLESMTDPLKELGKTREGAKPAGKSKEADKQVEEEPAMSEEERAQAEQTRRENIRLRQEFIPPLSCQTAGHAIVQPLVLGQDEKDEYVAWITDRGHLSVAFIRLLSQDMLSIAYRMETAPGAVMRPAYSPPDARIGGDSGVLFAASNDGFVYALYERGGDSIWRFSAGGPIVTDPTLVDTSLYVTMQLGGLYCIDAKEGKQRWFAPGIMQFVAAGKDRVYATDKFDRLQILNAKTGARLDNLPIPTLPIRVANNQTDRIYLVSQTGLVQCLREVEAVKPLVYREVREEAAKPAAAKQKGIDELEADKPKKPAGKKPAGKAEPAAEPGAGDVFGGEEGGPAGKPKTPAPKAKPVEPKPAEPKPKTGEGDGGDDLFR
jgi:outer membrane protein assembly factor BamB